MKRHALDGSIIVSIIRSNMMWKGIIARRKSLGRTSVREIKKLSKTGIATWRVDLPRPEGDFDIAIRWGCTSNVPEKLVLNTAAAIHQVNDKTNFRRLLMPYNLCPATIFEDEHIAPIEEFDFIVRPQYHAQGRRLYRCTTHKEWDDAIFRAGPNWYASEVFPKTHEYRVCIVQGRVAWVASKTPGNPDDIAWNVARGGRFDNVRWDDWPLKVVRYAVEAFALTDLDFGGVDVMWDAVNKEAAVLEINSAPSLTSPYRQEAMAKCFDFIMQNENKERIPLIKGRGGYKKFIHPAITAGAIQERV